jgi:ribosomal protein S18 acetylase RimI-like enzyme
MSARPAPPEWKLAIRRAALSDAALLAELGARTFSETYEHANTAEDMRAHLDRVFTTEARVVELADPDRATFIVERVSSGAPESTDLAGDAFGYATARRHSFSDGVAFRDPAELEKIYVLRAAHGLGAGAALIDAYVEQAKRWQCDGLWLGVWEENVRAIGFYQRMGFVVVGTKTFHLGGDAQNDLVMARSL